MQNQEEVRKRIDSLKDLIDHHRYLYHVLDKQEISDAALDSLKKELFDLEMAYPQFITPDSPNQRVGGKPLESFEKTTHKKPMTSFYDAFNREDMDDWEERNKKLLSQQEISNLSYYCEPKLDGLAIELTYEDGVLVLGSTRGDGKIGENVTMNIRTIEAIPLKLKSTEEVVRKLKERGLHHVVTLIESEGLSEIIVRGEAVLTKKEFQRVNQEREEQGLSLYANPRNLAAGSIRQLDPKVTASRKLDSNIYSLITDLGQTTHEEEHLILDAMGFKTNNKFNRYCQNLDEVFEYYHYWEENRDSLPYEVDGITVLVNDNLIFKKLGIIGKAPRAGIALKFPLLEVITKVNDITVQVGRTGAMTPVAVLEPVNVGGVIVSRATLHNQKEVERLSLKIGDTVVIGRAGDVIPEVIRAFPELRTGEEKDFQMPQDCPSCGTKLIKGDEEVVWRCPNDHCFARKKKYFNHFIARSAFNIEGLGGKVIERLLEEGMVKDPADLFDLTEGDLLPLERFGEKSAKKLISAIQEKKDVSLARFIYSLGIRNVGQKTANDLADRFDSLEDIQKLTLEDLEGIDDVGPIVAKSIMEWFSNEGNLVFIEKLRSKGVKYFIEKKAGNRLQGLRFVLTGSLDSLSREVAEKAIRDQGGEFSSSVSGKTDFVIVGRDPGSKYDKAKELGVKTIDETEFLKMIND